MCYGTTLPTWQARCVQSLIAAGAEPALLIIDEGTTGVSPPSRSTSRRRKLLQVRYWFWFLYQAIAARRSRAKRPVDLASDLERVPRVGCKATLKGRFSQHLNAHDLDEIRRHDVDFILRFAFGILRGEVLDAARFGIWSFHHDDEEKYRGGPPCFWEVQSGDRVTGAILQRLTSRLDSGIVLHKGYLRTVRGSYVQNLDQVLLESARWPALLARRIASGSVDCFHSPPSVTQAPIYRAPGNLAFLVFLLRMLGARLSERTRRWLFVDHWALGVVRAPVETLVGSDDMPEVEWLGPSDDFSGFAADPFGIARDGTVHVLFEAFPYASGRGHIAAFAPELSGIESSVTAIRAATHLSYPFLLEHDGEVYCVPESHEAREIALYRAEAFPDRWVKCAVLVPGFAGVDSTLIRHQGRWWMFTADRDDGAFFNLKIFHAPDLLGVWTPHALNPVKTDVRSARCAGRPFVVDEALYRPAMDYSEKVEGRIALNRIEVLDTRDFRESTVRMIDPVRGSSFPDKIHTLCGVGDITLVDGCREVCALRDSRLLRHKVGRIAQGLARRWPRPSGLRG